jgi:hypothetical protein
MQYCKPSPISSTRGNLWYGAWLPLFHQYSLQHARASVVEINTVSVSGVCEWGPVGALYPPNCIIFTGVHTPSASRYNTRLSIQGLPAW